MITLFISLIIAGLILAFVVYRWAFLAAVAGKLPIWVPSLLVMLANLCFWVGGIGLLVKFIIYLVKSS